MKRYTVLFLGAPAGHRVAIINRWQIKYNSNTGYFKGWYGYTLKEAYAHMKENPNALWIGQDMCHYVGRYTCGREMLYEISEKQLLALIKVEALTGQL